MNWRTSIRKHFHLSVSTLKNQQKNQFRTFAISITKYRRQFPVVRRGSEEDDIDVERLDDRPEETEEEGSERTGQQPFVEAR